MSKSKLSTYILLDRSGSMSGAKWDSSISSINEYVGTLRADGTKGKVTIAAFDGSGINSAGWSKRGGAGHLQTKENLNFTVLRDEKTISKFNNLKSSEIDPRGSTPLYDATAQLLNMAEENNGEKTIILIMTDGYENSSTIYNNQSIRDRLKTCERRGWEVVFLGAEFNNDKVAQDLGFKLDKVINTRNANQLGDTMQFYAKSASAYSTNGEAINTTKMRTELDKEDKPTLSNS